jgi:glyoxylase-like metal-dependent hydrolase (beta-lactamase superfamily II)
MKHAFLRGLIPSDFDSRSHEVDMTKPILATAKNMRHSTQATDLLGDESIIGVELPGHALGKWAIFARDDDGKLFFFVADAAWLKRSIVENRPPHKMANLLFPDPTAYRETWGIYTPII